MKLLLIVNVDWFFLSHRLPIALSALDQGFDVHIATTITRPSNRSLLSHYGFTLHELYIDRSGKNILKIIFLFFDIFRLCRRIQPDLVHLVTLQPVLIGGLAAQAACVKRIVYAISGLGHTFHLGSSLSHIRLSFIKLLYRLSLSARSRAVIFQNDYDKSILTSLCGLRHDEVFLIPGSGVDLTIFTSSTIPTGPPVVLMASRLLRTKGVSEFVSAANTLKQRGFNVRFLLAGEPDVSNPAAITTDELYHWVQTGNVEFLGRRDDVHNLMVNSHIICLPSYYPEGLPKVLCEASACGRAVVTTNTPGCRDAICDGVTGFLIPPCNSLALANAIEHLLLDTSLISDMGAAARSRAELLFDINLVVTSHLNIYSRLLASV